MAPSKSFKASKTIVAAAISIGLFFLSLTVAAWFFIASYQVERDEARTRVEAFALSMATDVHWYLEVARQTLRRVQAAGYSDVPASAGHKSALRDALNDLPPGVTIVVYNEVGDASTFLNSGSHAVNVSDRKYFQDLKHGKDWVISGMINDRVTGQKTFAVGVANRREGEFVGATVAYAPMHVFIRSWLAIGGREFNAFLLHLDGYLSARLPTIDFDGYERPVSPEFMSHFIQSDRGVYDAPPSPLDGLSRLLGFAKVDGFPIVAVVGLSNEELSSSFQQRAWRMMQVVGPMMVLLISALIYNFRIVREQEDTAIRLGAALDTNTRLFEEIHHRVKNNLQSILSLVRLHNKSDDPVSDLQNRIGAMIAVHEHIYKTASFGDVRAESYVKSIAQNVIDGSPVNAMLSVDIDDLLLPNYIVMPIGQLITEAVINALKYAFDGHPSPCISISLKTADGWTVLEIGDNGRSSPTTFADGMGSRLMRGFASQLNGKVETKSTASGVTVIVTFPWREGETPN